MKDQAISLGLQDRITWNGALAQEAVLDLYRSSDAFVLPCRIAPDGDRDGLPNVLVEASSQGLVCLSTGISGVPELLDDDVNGLVIPPEDPKALAQALERLIRNPKQRHDLGAAAEQRVRGEFDFQTSVDQLTSLFLRSAERSK